MSRFTGAMTALVTPFREDRLDESALRALVRSQVDAGIDGLVPCGTTGESVNLSAEEYRRVLEIVVDEAAGKTPVVAGAGSASTRHTIELAEVACDVGVDGLLVVVPYYNRPTQVGIAAHYRAVAGAVDKPIILYNVPPRCGSDLLPDTIAELADNPAFVAVKEATGDVARSAELARRFGDRFTILSGNDEITLPILQAGGHGVISVSANLVPAEVVRLVRSFEAGELDEARAQEARLSALHDALFVESNPTPAKAALAMLGRMRGDVRLPLVPPREASLIAVRAALGELGLL